MLFIQRSARERLAALPGGPYRKLRVLKGWIAQDGGPSERFKMGSSLFSVQHFRILVRLMLGEMPVQRVNAFYEHRERAAPYTLFVARLFARDRVCSV